MSQRPVDLGHLVRPPAPSLWIPPRSPGMVLAELREQGEPQPNLPSPAPEPSWPPAGGNEVPPWRIDGLIMPDLATLARVRDGLRRL